MEGKTNIITELQMLISMYEASSVRIHDPDISALLESLSLDQETDDQDNRPDLVLVNSPISLTLKLSDKLEIDIRIPIGYPRTESLSAHCTLKKSQSTSVASSIILQSQETELNKRLSSTLKNEASGEVFKTIGSNLFSLIDFCKTIMDELESGSGCSEAGGSKEDTPPPTTQKLCRIWIHSHHIYNKNKRKFLVDYARELNLSGISCPGKPGFVCVEGMELDCDEYWSRIRQLTWQKITLIQKDLNVIPAFKGEHFQELSINKSDFMKYLESKSLSTVIKEYLGF